MVAHDFLRDGVGGAGRGGEEVLPCPFFGRGGVFFGESIGEVNFAEAFFEVFLVDQSDGLKMQFQVGDDRVGQRGEAVFFAFAVTDDDTSTGSVQVWWLPKSISLTRRRRHSMRRKPLP